MQQVTVITNESIRSIVGGEPLEEPRQVVGPDIYGKSTGILRSSLSYQGGYPRPDVAVKLNIVGFARHVDRSPTESDGFAQHLFELLTGLLKLAIHGANSNR